MEASGTPARGAPEQPPPPTGPPAEPGVERPSAGWRILGLVLALALAFAAAVMIAAMVEIGDTPLEDECIEMGPACDEYFDGSSAQKTISLVLGWPSGVLAGIAALLALAFAGTGRYGTLVVRLTAGAIILGTLSILIGAV